MVGGIAIAASAAAVFASRPEPAAAYSGGNGDIDPASLTEIHYPGVNPVSPSMNPMRLAPSCAVAFMALLTAFHEQTGNYLPVDEGYRDLATQAIYGATGTSNHGFGIAVDFYRQQTLVGSDNYTWLAANAGRFGFTVLTQPFEAWHWNYNGTYTEEDDMTPQQAQSLADVQSDIVAIKAKLDTLVDAIWARPVQRNVNGSVQNIPAIQELADIKTIVSSLS